MKLLRVKRWLDSPLRLGLALSAALLVAFVASETFLNRWPVLVSEAEAGALARRPEGMLRDFRIAVIHCLLAGYLPAAFLAVLRGGRRTVLALRRALDCTDEECQRLARSIRFNPGGLASAAALGIAFGVLSPYIVAPVPEAPWNPATWGAEVVWHRTLGPWASAWGAMLVYAIVAVSGRMSRLASRLESVDLFDLRPLFPFTQQGLTNAALVLGFAAIGSLMLFTETGFGLFATAVGFVTLAAAALALLLPLRGVHGRIRHAKQAELGWVDRRLADRRAALKNGADGRTPGEYADLATYRIQVEEVSEWPINTSTYVRFALYLLIPVLSWSLAAIVERLIDALAS